MGDWNGDARTVVTTAAGMISEAGGVLAGLIQIFWPSPTVDVWGSIKDQVLQLIGQAIDANTYSTVCEDLQGLRNVMNQYLQYLNGGSAASVVTDLWTDANTTFLNARPHFQAQGKEVLLLPLFVPFANMHLSLLRDRVLFGASKWNEDAATVSITAGDLTKACASYADYVRGVFDCGYVNAMSGAGVDYHGCQPFRASNAYARQMTLAALDFADLWPFLDPTAHPAPVPPAALQPAREIYSDPYGTADGSGLVMLPLSPPTQPIGQLTVWGGDRIDAVQLTYPAGGGPDGATQTARMGYQGDGTAGAAFDLAQNPVTAVGVNAGDVPQGLLLTFQDGTTAAVGAVVAPGSPSVGFDGHVLSSVHVNGVSSYYASADCVVFGFRYGQSPSADLNALRLLYVGSPSKMSLAQLQQSCAGWQVDPQLLARTAQAEDWDQQRTDFWAQLAG